MFNDVKSKKTDIPPDMETTPLANFLYSGPHFERIIVNDEDMTQIPDRI